MSELRVAYVLGTTAGGTGRHVAMLASGVAAGGEVLVAGPEETRSLFAGNSAVAFEPVAISDRPRPVADLMTVLRLRRVLRRFAPRVVHAHGLRAGALTTLGLRVFPGRLGRAGLVVTIHNAPPSGRRLAAMYGVLERIVARRADLVLSVSTDLSDRMRRLRASEVDRAAVPAPDPGPVTIPAADLGGAGRPVVLGVGRLAPQKRFDLLLRAAAAKVWQARQPVPLLVIAGSGPLADELRRLADDLGVDARFLGERADVPALLAAADVFVLPSQWEGQPLILQEAMRAARPIVACEVGGVRDLTGDEAAFLVPPGDPQALAEAILALLDDAELAARLGAAAQARALSLLTEAEAIASAVSHYRRLGRSNRI